jgi:cytochrome c553
MSKIAQSLLLAGLAALSVSAFAAGDAVAAKAKVAMCMGCHGIEGYRAAFPASYRVPKIAGQHPQYLANALKAYRDGSRQHGSMNGIAGSLTDQDIADLAAYYGQAKAQ